MAAPTVVAKGTNAGTASLAVALTAAVPVGAYLLVAVAYHGDTSTTSITDSKGQAGWAVFGNTLTNGSRIGFGRVEPSVAMTTSDTVTINSASGSIRFSYYILAFTDFNTAPAFDVQGTDTGGTSTAPSASVTTTNAVDKVIAFIDTTADMSTFAPDAGWTNADTSAGSFLSNAGGGSFAVEWQDFTTTGSKTAAPTLGASVAWHEAILSYKAVAPTGPGLPPGYAQQSVPFMSNSRI